MLLTCDFEHICSVYSILLRCLMRQLANTYGVLIVIGYWSLMKWMNNIKFWALHMCYTSLLLWNLVPLGCFFNLSSFENWDAVTCAIASVLFWLPSPQFHQIPSCLGCCAATCFRIILLSSSSWARFAAQKLFWSIHPRWDEESFLFSSNKTRGSLEPCDALAVVWFSTRYCIHYYIVGLLACSKWDDGMHCHVFDRLDEPSPDLVDLVNASASLHVVCPMSLLCFVCAPHVPAW